MKNISILLLSFLSCFIVGFGLAINFGDKIKNEVTYVEPIFDMIKTK